MATQNQYDWFKFLYDEETSRYGDLDQRAKTYLSIITIYSGLVLLKADSIPTLTKSSELATVSVYTIAIAFVLALFVIVLGLQIRTYEGPSNPLETIEELPRGASWDDDSFFDERIAEIAVATQRNSDQNDAVANILQFVPYCLLVGVFANFTLLISFAQHR